MSTIVRVSEGAGDRVEAVRLEPLGDRVRDEADDHAGCQDEHEPVGARRNAAGTRRLVEWGAAQPEEDRRGERHDGSEQSDPDAGDWALLRLER
jgi:hypothetical protein